MGLKRDIKAPRGILALALAAMGGMFREQKRTSARHLRPAFRRGRVKPTPGAFGYNSRPRLAIDPRQPTNVTAARRAAGV